MGVSVTEIPTVASAAAAARDWARVAYLVHVSRALDHLEETQLVPGKKVAYQFSARGHDLGQVLLGLRLTDPHDGVCGYYRSRPILLSLGVPLDEALGSSMARSGGYSDGRDIGVVFNYPNHEGPSALPMCGGVGSQYTPTAGWAQAIEYRRTQLGDSSFDRAIGVVLGGDASVATNGFWSALTIATTLKLPMLFYVEDNGYAVCIAWEAHMSKLLASLEAQIAVAARESLQGELLARKAGYLARIGSFDQAHELITQLRNRFSNGAIPSVSIWIMGHDWDRRLTCMLLPPILRPKLNESRVRLSALRRSVCEPISYSRRIPLRVAIRRP